MQIASILQRSVHRHFHLSLRTAKRNGHMTRFAWSTSTGVKHLKMPRTLSGSERRGWLERYASPDSSQDEVQQLIYDQFGLTGFVELTESIHDTDYPYVLSEGLENDIAEIVSREKADRIYEQRAAVSSLGEEKLKSLIKMVFKAILEGDESDGSIAKRFDLSKATFSRFCGRSWSTNIPDLWKNLASIIASHPAFREYAKTTRYWEKIQNSNK